MGEKIKELIADQQDKPQLGKKSLELAHELQKVKPNEVVEISSDSRNKMIELAKKGGWTGLKSLLESKTRASSGAMEESKSDSISAAPAPTTTGKVAEGSKSAPVAVSAIEKAEGTNTPKSIFKEFDFLVKEFDNDAVWTEKQLIAVKEEIFTKLTPEQKTRLVVTSPTDITVAKSFNKQLDIRGLGFGKNSIFEYLALTSDGKMKEGTVKPLGTTSPKMEVSAPDSINRITDLKTRIEELETLANKQASDGTSEDELARTEARLSATKRQLKQFIDKEKEGGIKVYSDAMKDTTSTLQDVRVFDTFIKDNFATVTVGDQTYYIANKAKSAEAVKIISSDSGPVRDAFVTKMGAVKVKVGDKEYPAIATRDAMLGNYKTVEKKLSLNDAVAFDEKQHDKVVKGLKDIETPASNVAKSLTKKFIETVQNDPEQAKADLKKSILGDDPRGNDRLEKFLKVDFNGFGVNLKDDNTVDRIQAEITAVLNSKAPAFVVSDTGIAFDGVSMVPGAMLHGKIEGKNSSDGFYEVKSNTVDEFMADIPDEGNKLKSVLDSANNKGPIEFGGKVFEVKNGKVLTIGKPESTGFTLKDMLPSNYSSKEGIRDVIIVALAVKVWGVPHISLALPHISISLPSLSISLPHLSSQALSLLGGFGLGWFAASLYYGADADTGAAVKKYSSYQGAYNKLTGERSKQEFSNKLGTYINMSWDTEKSNPQSSSNDVKVYRPTGELMSVSGVDIILLASNKDDSVNTEKTMVKVDSKVVKLSTLSAEAQKKIIDEINQ